MVHLYPLKSSIFSAHFCARKRETHIIIMALQADQLMRGLQLDDASMQKLELDMREEVRVCFCVSFVRRGGAFLFECKSVSV